MRPEVQSWPDRHPLGNVDHLHNEWVEVLEYDVVLDALKER